MNKLSITLLVGLFFGNISYGAEYTQTIIDEQNKIRNDIIFLLKDLTSNSKCII